MLDRRQLLARGAGSPALLALAATAPGFVTRTARAAEAGKDKVLVVLEMTGGNDGLNTVVPYADDAYHKARPTLRLGKAQVVRVDDHVGLHPALRPLDKLLGQGQLAVVQGVGYPNPDRSHFESMDVWQSADPGRKTQTGWLGRGLGLAKFRPGAVPAAHVGTDRLPLALTGAATGVPTVHPTRPFDLHLDLAPAADRYGYSSARFGNPDMPGPPGEPQFQARRKLIEELATLPQGPAGELSQFVCRSQVQTLGNIERLRKIMEDELKGDRYGGAAGAGDLARNLGLVARMVNADFGTRVFYLSVGGFDTHSNQAPEHERLLGQVGTAVARFFDLLKAGGNAERVLLMTYSEFGRRVAENGSRGTDHGAGSCLLVTGPGVKGGAVGRHPSLTDLDAGDLRFHTDFRRVYATLLDGWLGCDSRAVLGGVFDPVPLLAGG